METGLVQLSANRRLVAESVGTSKLSRDKVAEIRRLRAEGWKLRELAARFGVSISAISQAANRQTWVTPTETTLARASEADLPAIQALVAQGLGYMPIAERLGLTGQSVHDLMNAHGLCGVSPTEVNRQAETCIRGHQFEVLPSGKRRCPQCYRMHQVAWRERSKGCA